MTNKQEVLQAFKLCEGDVILLNPLAFIGDKKELKKCPRVKFNDYNTFSIAKDDECSCGKILEYIMEFYTLKDILRIFFMFLFRKPKQEFIKFMWTNQ
jgi:hypothetical protein